eukprot:TRINITY_DN756_c0_g1_i1.p1 TRINITY_DN756_c0_g1~~TRINITY_DN756_c0_g1_i1.p1  ORF type:complete len:812 (+),score=120.31 TRINITY_DN756_c0_g1_i1:7400-9835(+)
MDEPSTRPPLHPSSQPLPAPSPRPTPPSSTTTIPQFYPSPTSVDLTASDEAPEPQPHHKPLAANSAPPHSNNHAPIPHASPECNIAAAAVPPPQSNPQSQPQLPAAVAPNVSPLVSDAAALPATTHSLQLPSLAVPLPSAALTDVTRAQFLDVLHNFLQQQPEEPLLDVDYDALVSQLRRLFDHLDGLVEQLPMRASNTVCDALAKPHMLTALLYLLSDVSAKSSPVIRDVRRAYRYPYIITTILANGTMNIRDAFINSKPLVAHLFSFLDGRVPLLDYVPNSTANIASAPQLACDNPVIVGNVVQILVSYLGTNPETLLEQIRNRPTFIPALVDKLHIGSVPQLLAELIPDRCVDDLLMMDHRNVSFDDSMTHAISMLASCRIFHLLAKAFVSGTQTIYDNCASDASPPTMEEVHRAEQMAFNVTEVYITLVKKTLRAVRIHADIPACHYLRVFGNASTTSTIELILNSGIELFRETELKKPTILENALSLITQLLELVEEDAERRVASVAGQPPPLDLSAFENALKPFLPNLIGVLIDIVNRHDGQSGVRLRILELFVTCMRVCSEDLMRFIDRTRFGEVALRIMMMHPRCSLIQHVVCRGVETGLVSPKATLTSVSHWLKRCNLPQVIMHLWRVHEGDARWAMPRMAQQAPYLSALVHLACCTQHFFAMQDDEMGSTPVVEVDEDTRRRFEAFFQGTMTAIVSNESTLCGPKPRRRQVLPSGLMGRAFGVMSRSSSCSSGFGRRSGVNNSGGTAHLVRSASAHRFGYVAPVSSLRSRFDEVFVEGGDGDFEAVTSFSGGFGDGDDLLG